MTEPIISLPSAGYERKLRFGEWLVAANGYRKDDNDISGVNTIGRHRMTDECFVLLAGTGYLVTAGFDKAPQQLGITPLQPMFLHVVRRDEWHALVLNEGAQTLIVENADTGAANTEKAPLNELQRAEIRAFVSRLDCAPSADHRSESVCFLAD